MMDNKCTKCDGCGKVANDEDQTPWTFWLNLPLQASGAILAGLVRPIDCPKCGGTGKASNADKEATNE